MSNDTPGLGSSEFGQRYGHVVTAGESAVSEILLSETRDTFLVQLHLYCPFYPQTRLWSFIFPVFLFWAYLQALGKYKSNNSAKNSHLQEHSRDVIAAQMMPRGSKNSRWGWLFSDQIHGTFKCLLKQSESMGGRRERVLEAFLWLHRDTPEDQGNEIGQWKDCFDKFCLKQRCCFLACRQRVWRDVTLTPAGRKTTYSYRPKYRISPAVVTQPARSHFRTYSHLSYGPLLGDSWVGRLLLMFYIFQAILWMCLSPVRQAPWGRAMKYCIAFSAPWLTSSLCPQNNSVAIGFRRRGALKPRGTALPSQMWGERWSVQSNVTFILELWPLGRLW